MTYIKDDTSFYEADLVLDWSPFFDYTFYLCDKSSETQLIDQEISAWNIGQSCTQPLRCCDDFLDWSTSALSEPGWNDAAAEDINEILQGNHPPPAFDALVGNWSRETLCANPINQQKILATTPYLNSSTSPSSIDIPVVKHRRRPRPYSCTSCSKAFAFPKDLRRHRLTHSNSKPHRCPIRACTYHQQGFSRKDNCSRHVRRAHPEISPTLRQSHS